MDGQPWPDDVLEAEVIARVLVLWIKARAIPPDDAYGWTVAIASVLKPSEEDAAPEASTTAPP